MAHPFGLASRTQGSNRGPPTAAQLEQSGRTRRGADFALRAQTATAAAAEGSRQTRPRLGGGGESSAGAPPTRACRWLDAAAANTGVGEPALRPLRASVLTALAATALALLRAALVADERTTGAAEAAPTGAFAPLAAAAPALVPLPPPPPEADPERCEARGVGRGLLGLCAGLLALRPGLRSPTAISPPSTPPLPQTLGLGLPALLRELVDWATFSLAPIGAWRRAVAEDIPWGAAGEVCDNAGADRRALSDERGEPTEAPPPAAEEADGVSGNTGAPLPSGSTSEPACAASHCDSS